ncbi:hypothetical protein [Micrococcus sp. KRD153]|uniref:hypothetical protein n=1 Tax=Micrococcus sp. KRD153 TaxID=2729724 RepID=UPI0019CF76CA|nr:hypothetical protein [Micrococcus sp. KRD153]
MAEVRLRRYSKPRGPGDQTSGGRGKLLNTQGHLTRLDVLVRETLQNSWDAADHENWFPAYGASIRRADTSVREILSTQIFTEITEDLKLGKLQAALTSPDLHVVEIFDRGTTGLNGPVRSGEAAPPGQPNNFNAFVFDIGTTKPQGGGSGGTYGFGKTATFEASAAHAVVYWTRCERGDGTLEDRLIASALHDEFDIGGKRYTGAHWWGDMGQEEILPLRGDHAKFLGEALFETHFGEEETGTSILVLAPTVLTHRDGDVDEWVPVGTDEQCDMLGQQMLDALVASAWPKVVPYGDGDAPMIVQFSVRGEEVDIATVVEERLPVYAHGLAAIRSAQLGEDAASPWAVPVGIREEAVTPIRLNPKASAGYPLEDYFGGRDDRTAGHLYMAKVLRDPLASDEEARKRDSLSVMRSETEIVVNYTPMPVDEGEMYEWFGVFKPTPECDRHFAASEPATHDAWNVSIPDNPVAVYVVGHTMQNVASKVRGFVRKDSAKKIRGEVRSARVLSRALNSFVPTGSDTSLSGLPAPSSPGSMSSSEDTTAQGDHEGGSSSGGRRRPGNQGNATVQLRGSRQLPGGAWEIDFEVQNEKGRERIVEAVVKAREWGGAVEMDASNVDVEWALGTERRSGPSITITGPTEGSVKITPHFTAAMTFDLVVGRGA